MSSGAQCNGCPKAREQQSEDGSGDLYLANRLARPCPTTHPVESAASNPEGRERGQDEEQRSDQVEGAGTVGTKQTGIDLAKGISGLVVMPSGSNRM
jgi:hypothetical protein